ncbi:ParM/StbA family protein [Leptothoe kymatousa]|uniref:Actin-like protein N-terminal domain-containing protein n=1 Tax=Leptothoe kymatousa TAU-MAC 1615 TaxID=2364775 RepID=A0ABS5Y410_9CYAN|nr:hypothetical protein [Leptothoe kymatousa]MBT9312560.1 hypothetical protein [Leptothoe kymatousa TAU-MAC 1615]
MLSIEANQQITSQSVGYANPAKPQQTIVNLMGVAVGAGWVKATNGAEVVKARSLILETEPTDFFGQNSKNWRVELQNSPIGQGVFYLGDKLDGMTGTKSLANGEKGNFYPVAAVAAIAQLLPHDQPHQVHPVEVACSIPTQGMKAQLGSLKGHHLVSINGASVQVNISRVVAQPEGLGTCAQIAHLQAMKGAAPASFAVLDIGFANTTITGLDEENTLLGFHSTTPGVAKLYETIAQRLNTNGHAATVEEVRLGVETAGGATFLLKGHGSTDFKDIYYAELERWFDARMSAIATGAQNILDKAQHTFIAGGGGQLPGVKGLAAARGYGVATDPQEKEVQGLYLLTH